MQISRYIWISISILTFIIPFRSKAHDGNTHVMEMRLVLGLQSNIDLEKWLRFISEDMIDNWTSFYNQLKIKPAYRNFNIQNHRAFFHWTLKGEPWNREIEYALRYAYPGKANEKYFLLYKRLLKNDLEKEQKKRRNKIEDKCKVLFGFNEGGTEEHYIRALCTIVYNTHIIGDYMTGNKQLKGLARLQEIIDDIIFTAKELDPLQSRNLISSLRQIKNPDLNPHKNADSIMLILQKAYPLFLIKAQKGKLKRRLEKRGFKFDK